MNSIVLISGEIATGKSAVARILIDQHRFHRVSTGAHLSQLAQERGVGSGRDALKQIGDALDKENFGKWVADLALELCRAAPSQKLWLLDSVRREFQIPWFKADFSVVVHAHLTATEEIARERYERRRKAGGE